LRLRFPRVIPPSDKLAFFAGKAASVLSESAAAPALNWNRKTKGAYRLGDKPEPLPRHPVRMTDKLERIMSYVLSLVVAATILGATEASSERVGLGACVRWEDNVLTVGISLNSPRDTDSTAVIKEGESEPPEMVAIIERNREDRERRVVMDR
jgi:hypothetical protein